MTDPIYRCPDHGFVTRHGGLGTDAECPKCGQPTEEVLAGERRRRLSKFVSGALRHFPADVGIELDERGWTNWDDLADAVARKYDWADRDALTAVVETDPKGRFERREAGGRTLIRGAYGHSVDVDLPDTGGGDPEGTTDEENATEIPDRLYHGTDPANLDSILAEGLRPMGRQEVHLTGTPAEARAVGNRHADDPVLLGIGAAEMVADDFRVNKRAESTFTAERVPPEYLEVEEADSV